MYGQKPDSAVIQHAEELAIARNDYVIDLDDIALVGSEDTLSIVAHGSPKTIGGGRSAQDVAALLREKGFQAGDIELVVCHTARGRYCFAQELANELGVPVKAACGKVTVVEGERGVPQVRLDNGKLLRPGVGWKTFKPLSGMRRKIYNWIGL